MLPKVFISHSSAQKESYAKSIVEVIGRDQCILDCYDFEPAYRSWDEIARNIDKSSFFVFLASSESLKSSWCEKEVQRAKQAYQRGEISHFLVYIIDPALSFKDMPDWMSKEECFNMKYFRSPIQIGRDVQQKLRIFTSDRYPELKIERNSFFGRNIEINDFQLGKVSRPYAKSLIISGRPGSGRKHFAKRCMTDLKMNPFAEPVKINLSRDERIEDLISQLNTITYLYSDDSLIDILQANDEVKLQKAVEQLREVSEYAYILIDDDRSIVEGSGHLSSWFENILISKNLPAQLKTFVTSTIKLRSFHVSKFDKELQYIDFPEMSFNDRLILLSEYIGIYGEKHEEKQDLEEFAKRLVYSPSQLKEIAKVIAKRGIREARQSLSAFENDGKGRIRGMLADMNEESPMADFLLIMGVLESCSYDNLKDIYKDKFPEIESRIPELIDRGIISEFGPSSSFLRIDSAVSRYIQQSGLKLRKELRTNLDNFIKQCISGELPSITEDLTTYLFTAKKAFEEGKLPVEKLFLPSVALKSIISLYYENKGSENHNYNKVVKLCKELLDKGQNIHLNEEYRQDVTYWLCLALAQLGLEKEFFKYVNGLGGDRKNFLYGFWFRNQHLYNEAKLYYQKVIDARHSVSKKKAQNEMVIVLTHLKDYPKAFDLAYELYQGQPDNPYYISSLFRVMTLRNEKSKKARELQDQLKQTMGEMLIKDKDQYIAAMDLYILLRNPAETPEMKFNQINHLREKYGHQMIKYLNEAILYALDYLGGKK